MNYLDAQDAVGQSYAIRLKIFMEYLLCCLSDLAASGLHHLLAES